MRLSAQKLQMIARRAISIAEGVEREVREEQERVAEGRRLRAEAAEAARERRAEEQEAAGRRRKEEQEARKVGLDLVDQAHAGLAMLMRRRESAELHWCRPLSAALLEAERSADRASSMCAVANPALALGAARSATQRVAAAEHVLSNMLAAQSTRREEREAAAVRGESIETLGQQLVQLWREVSQAGVEEEAAAAEAEVMDRVLSESNLSAHAEPGVRSAANFAATSSAAMAAAERRSAGEIVYAAATDSARETKSLIRAEARVLSRTPSPSLFPESGEEETSVEGQNRGDIVQSTPVRTPSGHLYAGAQMPALASGTSMLESPYISVQRAGNALYQVSTGEVQRGAGVGKSMVDASADDPERSTTTNAHDRDRDQHRDAAHTPGGQSTGGFSSASTTAERVLASLPTAIGEVLKEAEERHTEAVAWLERVKSLIEEKHDMSTGRR